MFSTNLPRDFGLFSSAWLLHGMNTLHYTQAGVYKLVETVLQRLESEEVWMIKLI